MRIVPERCPVCGDVKTTGRLTCIRIQCERRLPRRPFTGATGAHNGGKYKEMGAERNVSDELAEMSRVR